jgi:hypothetical protein
MKNGFSGKKKSSSISRVLKTGLKCIYYLFFHFNGILVRIKSMIYSTVSGENVENVKYFFLGCCFYKNNGVVVPWLSESVLKIDSKCKTILSLSSKMSHNEIHTLSSIKSDNCLYPS